MGYNSEDIMMEIYREIESKGLRDKFNKQLKKMKAQSKHAHKEAYELWEYALRRIKGWDPSKE
jgi:hypothetical protein